MTTFEHLCKNVEIPIDRLGADSITKSCEEKIHATTEPLLDVKVEEVEFTETSVSGSTCTVSAHSNDSPKAETPEKVFPRSKFDYAAEQSTQHTEHVEVSKAKKLLKCNICDYTTKLPDFFKAHKQRLARKKSRTADIKKREIRTQKLNLKCTICDFSSASVTCLAQHMGAHVVEKPFKCTLCDYASSNRSHLTRHMRTHTGVKPFKCIICDYSSAYSTDLTRHIEKHAGQKPFKCLPTLATDTL